MKWRIYILMLTALAVSGCRSTEKYAYLSDAPRGESMPIKQSYEAIIQTGDLLYIFVYSEFPKSASPFNQETNRENITSNVPGYRVDANGDIAFPILGRMHIAGLTYSALEQVIARQLIDSNYLKDPIVTASPMDFRVTVVGEVARPQLLYGNGNRMSIFEAIARCGDITMDGIRTNVKIIRNVGGNEIIDTLDLTSRSILDSPYYYLHSGDIIYVEPTLKKKRVAYRDEDWPRYLTTGISALQIAYSLVYRYFINPITDKYKTN